MRVIILLLSSFFLGFTVLSCEKAAGIPEESETSTTEISADASATREPPREMILVRGNYWVHGIPGFGVNGFRALSGDYHLSDYFPEFAVYVTLEPLFFPDEWHARPGMRSLEVLQRADEEGELAAVTLEDSRGLLWTAVFRFPPELQGTGFDAEACDRMLMAWTARFSYFLFLSASPDDISLPGAVEF